VVEQTDDFPSLPGYYQNLIDRKYVLEAGGTVIQDGLNIVATPTQHTDPFGIGFKFEFPKYTVSYTGDTGFFEELCLHHRGVDFLIINIISPEKEMQKDIMTVGGAIALINGSDPAQIFITHFGKRMLDIGPENIAAEIEKETGRKVIAALDGMKVKLESKKQTSLEPWKGKK
jgi:ribonuclease BN (tRNA processing enzyme)